MEGKLRNAKKFLLSTSRIVITKIVSKQIPQHAIIVPNDHGRLVTKL